MERRHNQTLPQKLARSRLSTASRLRTHAQQSHSSALPQKLARSRLSTACRLRTHEEQSHSSAHRYALRDDPWSAGTTKHCRRNLHAAGYLRLDGFVSTYSSYTLAHTGMRSVTIHGAPAQSNTAAETCTQQVIYGLTASHPRAAVTL
jgi:hypothetical protein